MTYEEMFNHLLSFELCIEQQQSALEATVGLVNVATRNDLHSLGGKSPHHQQSSQLRHCYNTNSNSRGRGHGGRRQGGPNQNSFSTPRPECQGRSHGESSATQQT